jgi:uncharacterized protein YkwD
MLIDLGLVAFFIACFALLLKRSQYNPIVSSFGLILAVLLTKRIALLLPALLFQNGIAKEGYTVIIGYLLLIIVSWGLLFAILANFRTEFFDKYKIVFSLISSVLFSLSVGIVLCFSLYYLQNTILENSKFCKICRMSPEDIKASEGIIIPGKMNDVISLKGNYTIDFQNSELESEVFQMINSERSTERKAALYNNQNLKNVALKYANSIIESLRFSHVDANNNSPADRASTAGIRYTLFGENLAIAPDIDQAHAALMNSPTHRANILSNKFSQVGIAVYSLKNGSVILVEEFSD